MKQKWIFLLLCLILLFPVPTQATVYEDTQYVVDQADVLTEQDIVYLENRAAELSYYYGIDVLIAVVNDMQGEAAGDFAASLNGTRGWWGAEDAIIFLLAMEEQEWYIATVGPAISAFSDNTLDALGYEAASYFSYGTYYQGFSQYLSAVENCLIEAQSGIFPDGFDDTSETHSGYYTSARPSIGSVLPVSLLIGAAVAGICLLFMRSGMNTRRKQRGAGDYLTAGSFQLRTRQDIFLYSNVSKTPRQQNSGGPGGRHNGSSIHRGSDGRSYGGRGGKF